MNGMISPMSNQQGSVMALALMVMVTLTIVGLMAINDTVMESAIARNHTLYRQSLYLAEAAVRQAAQIKQDFADDPEFCTTITDPDDFPTWLQPVTFDFGGDGDGNDEVVWDAIDFVGSSGTVNYGPFQPAVLVNGHNDACGFLSRYEGVAPGASLDMSKPTLVYQYAVYGRGVTPMRNERTSAVVKIGYRMRF